jgi:ubiquinone biosynthesis protein
MYRGSYEKAVRLSAAKLVKIKSYLPILSRSIAIFSTAAIQIAYLFKDTFLFALKILFGGSGILLSPSGDNKNHSKHVPMSTERSTRWQSRLAAYQEVVLSKRITEMFSILGPTFIKMGQVLSTRTDIVPTFWMTALANLQDHILPKDALEIKNIIEADFAKNIDEIFRYFQDKPLATASIGQVHLAGLHDGSDVVVKVVKPGVRELISIDIAILEHLTKMKFFKLSYLKEIDFQGFVSEFKVTILRELDYLSEATNCIKFKKSLSNLDVRIPEVFFEYSTHNVLTLEYLEGHKIDDMLLSAISSQEKLKIASLFTKSYLQMVFLDGFYHADPHQGNILILFDLELAFLDFGMVGILDEQIRHQLIDIALAIVSLDMKKSAKALAALGVSTNDISDAFISELERMTTSYITTQLGDIKLGSLLMDVLTTGKRYKLRFP